MGQEGATENSSQVGGAINQGLTQRFEKRKDFLNLTPAEKDERDKRLRGIPLDTLKHRRDEKACQRCRSKQHSQWYCLESQAKAAVALA
jgi:hypothetical protein